MSSTHAHMYGPGGTENLAWSPLEKAIARKAFDRALQCALEEVMNEAKMRAARIKEPGDLWRLEKYLAECRAQIDRQFDYRYSVLIFVFGNLIRPGKLTEQELCGLSEDKLSQIRRFAAP